MILKYALFNKRPGAGKLVSHILFWTCGSEDIKNVKG